MNQNKLFEMARDSGLPISWWQKARDEGIEKDWRELETFAKMIIKECVDKIETHQIPVGNSAAGEMACEWTYDALVQIREEILESFNLKREEI